ncbi:MAG TPA: ClpX C4-type zinc finger protein [Streptosporangiaceae bacterium]|nr:ClpX C4-type zinc finger protein [Streptosporangiaceae bacterium]
MSTADTRPGLACTFCMKLPADVETMVAGAGVFICNECVDLCVQIIASKPKDGSDAAPDSRMQTWEQKMSDEDLLAHLPRVAAASAQVEEQLTGWVRQARARGITWTRIGEALGMTRQSAWERFSGED